MRNVGKWTLAACCLGVLVMKPAAQTEQQSVDVYLLGGQSNMQGLGKVAELPAALKEPLDGVRIWTQGKFVEFDADGIVMPFTSKGEFGPETAFAAYLHQQQPDRQIRLIKISASGRGLDCGWDNQKWLGPGPGPGRDTFYPGTSADDPNQGNHYKGMLRIYRKALETLKAEEGQAFLVRGFIWMQGEQDSKNERSAKEYAHNLGLLHRRLCEDLGLERKDVPLVFGQALGTSDDEAPAKFTHRKEMRRSMRNAAHDSGHPDALANCYMVPTDHLPLRPDFVHYNTQGQLMLGERFARTVLAAQGIAPTASPLKLSDSLPEKAVGVTGDDAQAKAEEAVTAPE